MDNKGMMAVIVFVALGITAFIGIVLVDSLDEVGADSAEYQESFNVDDAESDKTCNLRYDPYETTTFTVEYHNGTGWQTLTASDYTLTGNVLVVNAAAMH